MKFTESKIWSYINKIQKQKKNWHFVRIESNTVNGIPDVNGVINGREYWIELKCNRGNNIGLSKYQLLWHSKRVQSGGKCFILHLTEKHEHIEILEVRDSRSRSRFPFPVLVRRVLVGGVDPSGRLHGSTPQLQINLVDKKNFYIYIKVCYN